MPGAPLRHTAPAPACVAASGTSAKGSAHVPEVAAHPPAVTFYLYAFNQEATVREACLAALAQDYPSEIVFSDDCSSDRTFSIMQDVAAEYRGPHTVRLNRNERNLGLIAHVNRSMEIATGELIVGAAGDDVSLPHRTTRIVERYLSSGRRANSIHSSATAFDASTGRVLGVMRPPLVAGAPDPDDLALENSLLIGATHAWTRRMFDVFGPIRHAGTYEDLIMAFRSALLGPIEYIDEPLVRYRKGNGLATRELRLRLRAFGEATARRRLATLEQRRADYLAVGRRVPRRLERRVECERLWCELFGGESWRALRSAARSPPLAFRAAAQATGYFLTRARHAATRVGRALVPPREALPPAVAPGASRCSTAPP